MPKGSLGDPYAFGILAKAHISNCSIEHDDFSCRFHDYEIQK